MAIVESVAVHGAETTHFSSAVSLDKFLKKNLKESNAKSIAIKFLYRISMED